MAKADASVEKLVPMIEQGSQSSAGMFSGPQGCAVFFQEGNQRRRSTSGSPSMVNSLRHNLSEITEKTPLTEHPARVEALRSKYGHTIEVLESPYPIENYTCGVHAFYLTGHPTYVYVAGFGLGRTFAGAEFVTFLLQNGLLVLRQSPVIPGDLIIYLHGREFRHVGRMKTEARVISKWGLGCLYEHDVWEVPDSYGDEVQYLVGADKGLSLDLFIRYAESKGFRFG